MISATESTAWALDAVGLPGVLAASRKRNILLVLTYHRIGDASVTPYDPHVISASADQFDAQLRFVKRHADVVDLPSALDTLSGRARAHGAYALVTFDDGYRDNYDTAFPILRRERIPAVFFITTAFVGTGRVPWWDAIAWSLRHSRTSSIHLAYPEPAMTLDVSASRFSRTLHQLLRLYKRPEIDRGRLLAAIVDATGCGPAPEIPERRFMNWHELRELVLGGMSIGSHTHTHPCLARLGPDRQRTELATSKRLLEARLSRPVTTLAYPEGGRDSFSRVTMQLAREAGYSAAFSFGGKINSIGRYDPFAISRVSPDGLSLERFRCRIAFGAAIGRLWP